jgi:hypothetical protein
MRNGHRAIENSIEVFTSNRARWVYKEPYRRIAVRSARRSNLQYGQQETVYMYTWAGAYALPHALRAIGSAGRVQVGLRSPMDLLACAGERERGGYAGAQSLQHAISSMGSALREKS